MGPCLLQTPSHGCDRVWRSKIPSSSMNSAFFDAHDVALSHNTLCPSIGPFDSVSCHYRNCASAYGPPSSYSVLMILFLRNRAKLCVTRSMIVILAKSLASHTPGTPERAQIFSLDSFACRGCRRRSKRCHRQIPWKLKLLAKITDRRSALIMEIETTRAPLWCSVRVSCRSWCTPGSP